MEPEYNTAKNKKRTRKDKDQVEAEPTNEIVETKKKKLEEDLPRGGFFRPALPQNQESDNTPAQSTNLFKFDSKTVAKKAKKAKKMSKKEQKQAEEMDVELSSVIHILKIESITVGVKTLGVISGFQGDKINVDLPNHLKGFISITEISDELNAKIMKDIEVFKSTTVNLKDYFRVGDLIRVVVSDLTFRDSDQKKRISLSLRPNIFNEGLDLDNIVIGSLIRGTIKSIEDHGYIINTGISQVKGFLPKAMAPQGLKVGIPIDVHVTSINKDSKILTLDANPQSFHKTFTNVNASVELLVPGILVDAEIFDTSSKGVFVKFLGDVLGTVYFPDWNVTHPIDIEETFKQGTKVKARIMWVNAETHSFALSFKDHFVNWQSQDQIPVDVIGSLVQVTVTYVFGRGIMVQLPEEVEGYVGVDHLDVLVHDVKTISQSYPVGSSHTGRVMSYDYFNQVPVLTLKEKEIESPIFSFSDVNVGDIVEAEPFDIQTDYVRVRLSEFVTGVCYSLHWSDSNLKNPAKKFQAGRKSKFRVIKVDPKNRILLLTSKPSIIDCSGVIPNDYSTVRAGDIISGWVVKVGGFGLLLAFFDDLVAVVLKADLNIDSTADHYKFFHMGQVLQCKVVNVNTDQGKMRVTLNLEDTNSGGSEYTPGQIISAKISQIDKSKSILRLELPNKEKAMLNFANLSEFHTAKIPGNVSTKTPLNVLVLNDRQVTAKPLLLENSEKIPKDFSEIKVGETYYGSAQNSRIGTFVKFLGNLQGLDPMTRDLIETGTTVKFHVSEKDESKQRVKGTVKCQWDHKLLLEQFYKEEESLSTVNWKKFQIGGVVDLVVKEIVEEGVVMETNGVNAFALLQHAQGAKVGDKVKGKILDVDYDKNVLDVSLNSDFVKIKNEKLSVLKNQEATVKLVKKNIVVLTLQNDKSIGFALSKDLNESSLDAFSMFVVGQKVNVEVKGVYSGIQERNLLQIVKEESKKQTPNKKKNNSKKQ